MIKKVSIVFHSVCGNNYLIANEFYNEFKNYDIDVNIYRIEDVNYESLAEQFEVASQYKDEILKLQIASPEKLLDSDLIIMGSPTYYGNVSGAMKIFMDSFSTYWTEAKFWGKKLFSFSTSGNAEGGGDMCLNCINVFGLHMGMIPIPIPSNLIAGKNHTAYGLLHYVGDNSDNRPNEDTRITIKAITKRLLTL